jgi:leader peptidase (prepilin peptidase)/N-methyltransferase
MILILIGLVILGLIAGSFINMLAYRLPIMMKREWREQSYEILGQTAIVEETAITLATPRSFCPHCKTSLKIWHNLPLLSYLFLGGRCGFCKQRIPLRYLMTELLCGALPVLLFFQFGLTLPLYAALLLSWGLIAISVIDIEEMFIPDSITLFLLWAGLLANTFYIFTTPSHAILGAAVGYTLFWGVAKLFTLLRQKEGLGYGDFKLLAMLGAWFGVSAILNIILVASITGIITVGMMSLVKRSHLNTPFPFGPFLALGGWCTLFFGDVFTHLILK